MSPERPPASAEAEDDDWLEKDLENILEQEIAPTPMSAARPTPLDEQAASPSQAAPAAAAVPEGASPAAPAAAAAPDGAAPEGAAPAQAEESEDWLAQQLEEVLMQDSMEQGDSGQTGATSQSFQKPMQEDDGSVPPPPPPFTTASMRAEDSSVEAPKEASKPSRDDGMGKTEDELFGSDIEADKAAPASGAKSPAGGAASMDDTPSKNTPGKDGMVDETRFMTDQNGNKLLKWKVDYAQRGGGGRASCHDNQCLEKEEQGGMKSIEKGCLRIGRRVLMDKDSESGGHVVIMWYHACCIINAQRRSRQSTRVIESPADLEGFDEISKDDQEMLRRIIENAKIDLRQAREAARRAGRGMAPPGGHFLGPQSTPQKRGLDGFDAEAETAMKKPKKPNELKIEKGERIWCYCRVRPEERPGARPPGAPVEVAVRSPKPELGMIVDKDRDDATIIVQFESAEHEKERLDMFASRKYARIRAWLKYPRLFEGKKQRIPLKWVQQTRVPPRLCSCNLQSWNHKVKACDLSCSRGTQQKVFGVDL